MFPDGLWERCISTQEDDEQELKRQERSYAEAYLKTLGRNAAIGDYSDFPHTIPSDVGISTEVSNKIDEVRKYAEDPLSYAPFGSGQWNRLRTAFATYMNTDMTLKRMNFYSQK